jgi:hypothetical protein
MLKLRLIRDSNSKPSWTLSLAVPSTIVITLWFIVGGLDLSIGDVHILTATKSGSDYALAVGVWLTFIAQRGWRNKESTPPVNPSID